MLLQVGNDECRIIRIESLMVEKLSSYTPQDLADLDALMHELSATSFCNEELLNNANVIRGLK